MKINRTTPVLVKDPDKLTTRGGMAWCEDHGEYFLNCICPKKNSTPETDGWHIEITNKKSAIAYPTQDMYEELQLWIVRKGDTLVCSRCDDKIKVGYPITEIESHDITAAFFELHGNCTEPEED